MKTFATAIFAGLMALSTVSAMVKAEENVRGTEAEATVYDIDRDYFRESHGSIIAPHEAAAGETVTVTVDPNETWYVSNITVTTEWTGEELPVDYKGNICVFVMPEDHVVIHVDYSHERVMSYIDLNEAKDGIHKILINGYATDERPFAYPGDVITLYADDDVKNITVRNAEGDNLALTNVSGTVYEFIMPDEPVYIAATK